MATVGVKGLTNEQRARPTEPDRNNIANSDLLQADSAEWDLVESVAKLTKTVLTLVRCQRATYSTLTNAWINHDRMTINENNDGWYSTTQDKV